MVDADDHPFLRLVLEEDPDAAAVHSRSGQPPLPDRCESLSQENPVPLLERVAQKKCHLFAGKTPSRLIPERCGRFAMRRIKILPGDVHIQADPHHDPVESPSRCLHLGEYAAYLPPPDEHIVRPFEFHAFGTENRDQLGDRYSRRQGDPGCIRRVNGRAKEKGGIEVAAGRRLPDPLQTPPTPGLTVGEDYRSFGRSFPGKFHSQTVRRINDREEVNPPIHPASGQTGLQRLRVKFLSEHHQTRRKATDRLAPQAPYPSRNDAEAPHAGS